MIYYAGRYATIKEEDDELLQGDERDLYQRARAPFVTSPNLSALIEALRQHAIAEVHAHYGWTEPQPISLIRDNLLSEAAEHVYNLVHNDDLVAVIWIKEFDTVSVH